VSEGTFTTQTFLVTDIEGSLRRWDEQPEAMWAAQVRHDDVVSGIVAAHGGRVFKTVGDAFCVAFANAGDALDAAIGLQRALAEVDWSAVAPGLPPITVRAAIHTGAVQERDGDYFGVPGNSWSTTSPMVSAC
jgi:class 3 adenylate cyclase